MRAGRPARSNGARHGVATRRRSGDWGWAEGHAAIDSADPERLRAVRMIHQKEQIGDCVEDGERFPCKTIRVLDWVPDEKEMD